jgi:hypothetical protein
LAKPFNFHTLSIPTSNANGLWAVRSYNNIIHFNLIILIVQKSTVTRTFPHHLAPQHPRFPLPYLQRTRTFPLNSLQGTCTPLNQAIIRKMSESTSAESLIRRKSRAPTVLWMKSLKLRPTLINNRLKVRMKKRCTSMGKNCWR